MNFSLIPMPASEELAMGYVPPIGSSDRHTMGEPISFRVVATLYLLLLLILQFPSDDPWPDAQSGAAETASLAESSCEGCAQPSLPPIRKRN